MHRTLLTLALVLGFTPVLHAQRDAKVPDPDPEIQRKSFILPEGFEVNLYAADPLLAKPVQMNFDAAGRLWVACSEVYPQIKPGQVANDKILILEDTKGVGKADKVTVFADGLLIPTGLEPGDGGCYVANSTDIVHFSDPDEKGKARKKRIVLSGFGTEDTHHIVHTFRWGMDGMLYFNQSVYIHSHIETPHGPRRLNAGGIWQYRPETMQLEVFVRGFWNTWGHHFDRWGQSFITDGANGEGINYGVPGAYYAASQGGSRLLTGLNPGSPKHCGLEVLSGRHLPPDWAGSIITNDFRGHRVCRFVLKEDGAGYLSQEKTELIKTKHPAFRPIDVKMGPDGAIYIADWYNPIIQHGEVDFRDPRRDITHGRIWRITAKDRPLVEKPKLVDATVPALLDALKAPEDFTRHHAKRVLKERGAKAVLPELAKWVATLDAKDKDIEHHQLEALWVYQGLDVVEPKLLTTLLNARDHHARAAAARVAGAWQNRLPNALELLAARAQDEHPQVRLEAVRALGGIPNARAADAAVQALDKPADRWIDYGLWLTLRDLEKHWMPELQAGKPTFANTRHLLFALQAAGSQGGSAALKPLMGLLKSGKVAPDRAEGVLTLVAAMGGPPELGMVFEQVLAKENNPPSRQAALLAALEQATRQRGVKPEGDLARLAPLLGSESEALKSTALRTAGLWKVEGLRPQLVEIAGGEKTSPEARHAAIDGLVALGGKPSQEMLEQLTAAARPLDVRRRATIGLAGLNLASAAARAVEVLGASSANDAADVFTAFVQQKGGAVALAKALSDKKLPADVAKVGIRTVRLSGRDSPELIASLGKAGSLGETKFVLSAADLERFLTDVRGQGDPVRGEAVYRRKDMVCQKCHAIAGAGGQVGPDLTSIGASAPLDYLIESLLLPSKAIKENYHAVIVGTKAGQIITGIKVRENKTELVLRDAEDREAAIPIKDIEDRAASPTSLMPEGMTDTLTRAELVDLARFLSELGKLGPYAASQARVVRRWQVLEPSPQVGELLRRTRLASATTADPALVWTSAYSEVSGTLPFAAVPTIKYRGDTNPHGFARFQLDVTTAGKALLKFNNVAGLSAWLDGNPVEFAKDNTLPLDLTAGVRTLTLAIDAVQRKEPLRCELEDVADSPARVRILGGK